MMRSRASKVGFACVLLTSAVACRSPRIACPVTPVAPPDAALVAAPPVTTCPPVREYPFRNLVFEGGGVKGLVYGGALEVLQQQGILDQAERVAGTSAGSITALLVALRYTPEEIRKILLNLDFRQFEDGGSTGIFRLFHRFGWYRGDNLLDLMRCLVAGKANNRPRATFRDLHEMAKGRGFLDLHVYSTDLTSGQVKELSYATTPDLEVALAVRMSSSFPVFFASIEEGASVFVDGGVVLNYPINTFDGDEGQNPATLGFVLLHPDQPPQRRDIRGLVSYSQALAAAILSVQEQTLENDPANLQRTVILNDLGISTLDFNLTEAQKKALLQQGVECTCSYLADWQAWQAQNLQPAAGLLGRRVDIKKCGSAFPR